MDPPSAPNPLQKYFQELDQLPPKETSAIKDDEEKPGHVLVFRGKRFVSEKELDVEEIPPPSEEELDVEELYITVTANKKQRLMPCWTCNRSGEIEIIVAVPDNLSLERRACDCCNGKGERNLQHYDWMPPPPTSP